MMCAYDKDGCPVVWDQDTEEWVLEDAGFSDKIDWIRERCEIEVRDRSDSFDPVRLMAEGILHIINGGATRG